MFINKIFHCIYEKTNLSCKIESLEKYFHLFVLIFLFNYIQYFYISVKMEHWSRLFFYSMQIVFFSFLVSILACSIDEKYKINFLKKSLIVLFFIIFSLDAFSLYYYDTLINSVMINAILETSRREASEYLQMHLSMKVLFVYVCGMFSIYYIYKEHITLRLQNKLMKKLFSIILILGAFASVRSFAVYEKSYALEYPPIFRIYYSIQEALGQINRYEKYYSEMNSNVPLIKNNGEIKNVILVLGESASRNHMGIYGYDLNTTPYLQRKENLFVYRDIISPYAFTTDSLSKVLTFSNWENKDIPWWKNNNIIDIMKSAGYKTYWISNQEKTMSSYNILASRSDKELFLQYRTLQEQDLSVYDEKIIPLLENVLNELEEKKFIVVHMMGSHYMYKFRYPKAYEVFDEKDIAKEGLDKSKRKTIAEYDNSILYTDFILNEIFKKSSEKEAIVIYISDHGEEVYDKDETIGHANDIVSRYMVEIPMMIWVSKSFEEKYVDKINAMRNAQERPYMIDDLIYSILDLVDVHTKEYTSERSLFNDSFHGDRKRITCGIDYDDTLKLRN